MIAMAISARSKGMPIPNPIIKLEWSEKKNPVMENVSIDVHIF